MSRPTPRLAVGALTLGALTLATLAGAPADPAAAAPSGHGRSAVGHRVAAEVDRKPTSQAAAWLTGQLTDGLVHNDQYDFDDDGLSIDVALALDEIGGHSTAVGQVADGVAGNLATYIGDGTTEAYAGATAKSLVLAQVAGQDPTAFGGVDLVSRSRAWCAPTRSRPAGSATPAPTATTPT